jgi:hypothetical protein
LVLVRGVLQSVRFTGAWEKHSMKHWPSIFFLLTLVSLLGCGGAGTGGTQSPLTNTPNITGNWQFSATSMTGTALSIAGSIKKSNSKVSGAVHVDGSTCFDRLTTVGLAGTLTGNNVTLTSNSAGQVTTFTGNFTDTAFTGTYTIKGGCADGEQGNVTAAKVIALTSTFNGTFTAPTQTTFDTVAQLAQGNDGPDGSFALSGTVTFTSPCFGSGTIKSGRFPSGSFILGTSVALEIETNNGTVAFSGTNNQNTGEISGNYSVSGGTCDDSGTAILTLASSPWDY